MRADLVTGSTPDTLSGSYRVLVQSFLRHPLGENKAPRTVGACLEALRPFGEFLDARGMPTDSASFSRAHVEEFVAYLLTQHKPPTGHNSCRALQAWFK